MSKSIVRSRSIAFARQSGLCYYCGLPMWLEDPASFARKHGITAKQAKRLRCTAEHLLARQDGGGDSLSNLVAACWHCNTTRHKCKGECSPAPNPERYKAVVQARMSRQRWHGEWAFREMAGALAYLQRDSQGTPCPSSIQLP